MVLLFKPPHSDFARPSMLVVRRFVFKRRMRSPLVVERHPTLDNFQRLEAVAQLRRINRPLLERPPQAFNEDIVHAAPAPIHGHSDACLGQSGGPRRTRELTALIRIHDLGWSVGFQSFLQRFDAKACVHGI